MYLQLKTDVLDTSLVVSMAMLLLIADYAVCRCVHCQKMAHAWIQLAERFSDVEDTVIAEVDCSQQSRLCQEQEVS